jgi:hypothetical protein
VDPEIISISNVWEALKLLLIIPKTCLSSHGFPGNSIWTNRSDCWMKEQQIQFHHPSRESTLYSKNYEKDNRVKYQAKYQQSLFLKLEQKTAESSTGDPVNRNMI